MFPSTCGDLKVAKQDDSKEAIDISGLYFCLGALGGVGFRLFRSTWRLMGSYMWSYKSPNIGYNYSCPTYNPIRITSLLITLYLQLPYL